MDDFKMNKSPVSRFVQLFGSSHRINTPNSLAYEFQWVTSIATAYEAAPMLHDNLIHPLLYQNVKKTSSKYKRKNIDNRRILDVLTFGKFSLYINWFVQISFI